MDDVFHCPLCGEVPAAYDPPGWHALGFCDQTLQAKLRDLRASMGEFAQTIRSVARSTLRLRQALDEEDEP